MTTETTIFTKSETPKTETQTQPVDAASKDAAYWEKRFRDSQNFIEELKAENAEFRQTLKKSTNLEELYDRFTRDNVNSTTNQNTPASNVSTTSVEPPANNTPAPAPKGVTPEEVSRLVAEALDKHTTQQMRASNIQEVQATLKQIWGKDYLPRLQERVQELNVDPNFIDDVASKSPKAVYALLNVAPVMSNGRSTATGENPPSTNRNMAALQANIGGLPHGAHGYKYYSDMRKNDPKTYYKPATQLEMFKMAKDYGDDFYNN